MRRRSQRQQNPIFQDSVSYGAPFWNPGLIQSSILKVLGSLRAAFFMIFERPKAPGQAPEASLCSKGGLDRFLNRF